MYLVLIILVVLFIIYKMTKPKDTTPKDTKPKSQEPFTTSQDKDEQSSEPNIPKTLAPVPPALQTEPAPYMPVGLLVSAPYQQVARNSPRPYQDPALVKTTRQRILDAVEMLKGFLAFQANEIEYRSDPTIQLPLTTARADFQRLSDEANVLQRNPGLQPDMTEKEINEIMSNLAFLQREVTLIGANRPFNNTGLQNLEGFEDAPPVGTDLATEQDLIDFSKRLDAEIKRLSESGTTDPIINSRITSLTTVKNSVNGIIEQLQSGTMLSTDVPISKKDIQDALPVLGDTSKELPNILRTISEPNFFTQLASALKPSQQGGEDAIPRNLKLMLEQYATEFAEGVSAAIGLGVGVKYTSKRDLEIEKARAEVATSTVAKTGFPSMADLSAIADSDLTSLSAPYNSHNIGGLSGSVEGPVTDAGANDPRLSGRAPLSQASNFDWKARAKHIEGQIRKRGYKDSEYGLMPANNSVSAEFSWKGYAKMLCTRLQANMDTGLAEACGCPPIDWRGW
jgi:hypothetical protein